MTAQTIPVEEKQTPDVLQQEKKAVEELIAIPVDHGGKHGVPANGGRLCPHGLYRSGGKP